MTVDELSAMIDECAGESVLHEAYAADPEQTRATLEKLVYEGLPRWFCPIYTVEEDS